MTSKEFPEHFDLNKLNQPNTALDAMWAQEATDRLAAYRRGEIKAVNLSEVIAKYEVGSKHS